MSSFYLEDYVVYLDTLTIIMIVAEVLAIENKW